MKGILAMLFVATAISCEKDQRVETKENIALTSEVVRAKEFVEARITDGFSLKSAGGEQSSMKIRARWENAKVTSNNHFVVVEAEIEAMGQFGFMSSETYQKFQESGNPMYKYSLSRMVVLENKRTGKMYSFIMSIAGDREYLEGKNFKILGNGYLKKEQDFSGFVLFHELTGEFTNGWVYCDGKITNTIVEADKLGVNLNLKQATIHYYVWVETCTDYIYINTVNGEITKIGYNGTKCTQQEVYGGSYTIGSEMPTSGGGGEYGPAVIEAGEACGCTICPVCGGCMVDDALKVAQLPGDDTPPPTFFDCEVCSCPKIIETDIFKDYTCTKNILRILSDGTNVDVKNLKINPTFTASILSLFDMSETVNLILDVQDAENPDNNATTTRIENSNEYKITFNSSYLNTATDLSIARTFIHEILHANLLYKFDKKEDEFSSILVLFRETGNPSENYLHHQYIADHLVPTIANNLYEWCRGASLYVDYSYCEKMAWAGLIGVPEYESHPKKSEIERINVNEKLNNNEAKGRDCN